MTLYDFSVVTIDGERISMKEYAGKVLLIVNTASQCGFTPQYKTLEKLWRELGPRGFVVLGFPCDQFGHQEPGDSSEIKGFCELNYGVTFPLFEKIEVNGDNAHPLYQFLKAAKPGIGGADIKWNFTKFLVDGKGTVLDRFSPAADPAKLRPAIISVLPKKP